MNALLSCVSTDLISQMETFAKKKGDGAIYFSLQETLRILPEFSLSVLENSQRAVGLEPTVEPTATSVTTATAGHPLLWLRSCEVSGGRACLAFRKNLSFRLSNC